jgi:hypothetical protein
MFPHERSLVKQFQGRPFAVLGIDKEQSEDAREAVVQMVQAGQMTWRNWFDADGRITHSWHVNMWPTLYLIDHKGIIRRSYEGAPASAELDATIEHLVKEAEKDRKTS